jgi:galactose oxidase
MTIGARLGIRKSTPRRGRHLLSLAPDGRVFVAGGRSRSEIAPPDAEDEKPTFRYLYPPYMIQTRPAITAAPATIGYGASFSVAVSGGPISEAVLIGLGSMTHALDSNQRHVQLAVVAPTSTSATVIGPPDRQTAPPGHYMLFVLNQANVPSIARIVHLE